MNKLTLQSILKEIRKVKSCDLNYLMKIFNCRHVSVMNYLRVLGNRGVIILSNSPKLFNSNTISKDTTVYLNQELHSYIFDSLKEKFKRYDIAAKYFNRHKATLSAWKLKKNRMPLKVLEQICSNLNIIFDRVTESVEETDRLIIEAI